MVSAIRQASCRLVATGFVNPLRPISRTTTRWQGSSVIGGKSATLRFAGLHTSLRQTYRHLANSEPINTPSQGSTRSASSKPIPGTPSPANAEKPPSTAATTVALEEAKEVSDKEQRSRDWAIVRKLAGNIWPSGPGSTEIKIRVVGALGLLVAGKVSSWGVSVLGRSAKSTACVR
jgi:hypothetical protein